jgi:hypothetical protein
MSLDPSSRGISQGELAMAEAIEAAYATTRERLCDKLNAGAVIETGRLQPNRAALIYPHIPLVHKAPARRKPVAASALAISTEEARMLVEFRRYGVFDASQLRGIIDRFQRHAQNEFRAKRDQMATVGCWNVSKYIVNRSLFGYRVRRVRTLIALQHRGLLDVRGCIISDLYTLNRAVVCGPSGAIFA